MRFQFFALAVAIIVSLAVGAGKWRARMTAASDFSRQEREGRWIFVQADTTGVMTWSRAEGRDSVRHYRNVHIADAAASLTATPDLARVAYVDNSKWDAPGVAVRAASISEKPIAIAATTQGHQIACPRFDADGSLLFLDTGTWQPASMSGGSYAAARPASVLTRASLPVDDTVVESVRMRPVRLAAAIAADDCPDLSADGSLLAWVGTDHMVHIAKRAGDHFLDDHKTFTGMDADLSPDGEWLAMVDGGKLVKVDVASGSRDTIAQTRGGFRVGAISPDGTWIAVKENVGMGSGGWTAYRVKDGAPVALDLPQRVGYYGGDHEKVWIARTSDLPDPTPIPTRTPKPRTTPGRRRSP